jgi:hypothetical protein
MTAQARLSAKNLALTVTFTALYVVFGFIRISPIIGLPGQAITAAAMMAPLVGIILGPYIGTLSALFGGIIGFFFGSFALPSLASGVAATFCSGMIRISKRTVSVIFYLLLLLFLAFYPTIGPLWLLPMYLWFQIIGLVILTLPLPFTSTKTLNSTNDSKLVVAFLVTCLTSTLAGQIAGSLTFELILTADLSYWLSTWGVTMVYYPVERAIIAVFSALIGVSLHKVLKDAKLMPVLNHASREEK